MRIRHHLAYNRGRSWHRHQRAFAKGFAFRERDERLLEDSHLARYLDGPSSRFADKVQALSGEFAAVLIDQPAGQAAAAVDRVRSIPLFYGRDGDMLFLSDDAEWIARRLSSASLPPPLSMAEFMLFSMTTGPRTLSPDVFQLQAGELLYTRDEAVTTERYFQYGGALRAARDAPLHLRDSERAARVDEGVATVEAAFQRFLQSVDGRPLAVPLSGGLDSRLVAAMLARAGRTDTLCFSYGRPGGFEARRSRHVAKTLGLRWRFVPYTNQRWHDWYARSDFQRYRREAANLCAIEHEQDWPAVLHLRDQGHLPDETVFVPGHTGDAGKRLPEAAFDPSAPARPAHWIWKNYYALWPTRRLGEQAIASLKRRIAEAVPDLNDHTELNHREAARAFEQFDWQERQTKMILNSVRAYEFHGFDWRAPLWDTALMRFWSRVPLFERRNDAFYRRVCRQLLGEELYNVPFTTPTIFLWTQKFRLLWGTDYRYYGAHLGPSPVKALFTKRVRDYVRLDHPILDALTGPWQWYPLQRVPINGLNALFALQDAYERLQH